ncbi:hypothetical protein CEE37_04375 [candidate division LCP-89 bacterium B3_LCP]|uniref:RmlD-like substrate binding domain-containing protein n=1 Tax=candidate division LCP-89 bacterium B3_LCP TaxID=2012998 RepID=A0A532V3L6_UNCL8|nr:MAG: hypothetical protein CEE37_04375 [candidate division LCP-89 bacterium B3_LCP]
MRILITGASGFIGGTLYCSSPDKYDVWGTYHQSPVKTGDSQFIELNLLDYIETTNVLNSVNPDVIIHCAALSKVSFCQNHPSSAWDLNNKATEHLVKLINDDIINTRLIFLSSDMVFNGQKGDYCESDQPDPINLYGQTKLAAEEHVARLGAKGTVLRLNLVYGRPVMGGSSFSEEVIHVVKSGKPYHLFVDQHRSFMSVKNLTRCIWEVVASDFHGVLHLGGNEPADRVIFAYKLARKAGLNTSLLLTSNNQGGGRDVPYPKNNTFDLSLAKSLLKTRLLAIDDGLDLEYPP